VDLKHDSRALEWRSFTVLSEAPIHFHYRHDNKGLLGMNDEVRRVRI